MKSNKDIILKLYFEDKLKQVEISKFLNISNNAVSKVVKHDPRYEEEKNNRKKINKQNRNKKIQNYVETKRKNAKGDVDYLILKAIHNQDVRELSGGKNHINNRAFRKWNASAYKYNTKSQCYKLVKGITTGYDVPKKIR